MRKRLVGLLGTWEIITVATVLVFATVLSLLTPRFLTVSNLRALVLAMSMELPVAVVMQVLLILGLFDLSVGSISAFSGMIVGMALRSGYPPTAAVLAGLSVGALLGCVNGTFVARFRFNALIVTLAMMSIARGLALGFSGGNVLAGFPRQFAFLGQGQVFGLPFPVLLAALFVGTADYLLRSIRTFRQVYYIGANERAATYAGIEVSRIKTAAFIFSGAMAAVAGILVTSRVMASTPTLNEDLPLRVIAACIIGGASLSGGEGTILGALLGLSLMFLINNAMVLLGISVYWQGVVIGSILLVALGLDTFSKRRRHHNGG